MMKNEKTLKAMKGHLNTYLEKLFEAQDNNEDLSKFDITFTILGQQFTLANNADLYNDLESLVNTQIEEI